MIRSMFAAAILIGAIFIGQPAAHGQTMTSAPTQLTMNLTIGSTGPEVVALQTFLEQRGYLSVPTGVPKGYFGSLTRTAVARYQVANNIAPAAGYFGPLTRASVNTQINTGSPAQPVPGFQCPVGFTPTVYNGFNVCIVGTGTTTNPVNPSNPLRGDEASLENFDTRNGGETNIEEGDERAEILDFRFNVEDADVRVERVDVHFRAAGSNAEDDPWKVFDSVTLWYKNQRVATVNTDSRDAWSREGRTNPDTYRVRFTGVDTIVREGERAEFTISVDVSNSVRFSNNSAERWTVFVPNEGVRVTDAAGITQNIGNSNDTVMIDIGVGGQNERLSVRNASDERAQTLQVERSRLSDWHTIFSFELEAEDNDIEITNLPITLQVFGGNVYNDVFNRLELVIDGETFSDYRVLNSNGSSTIVQFEFDRDELVLENDDTVTAELRARFNSLTGNYVEGTSVLASLTSTNVENIDAEGADDLRGTQLRGSADGELQTLRTQGLMVGAVNTRAPEYRQNVSTTLTDDQGVYFIEFDVTAFNTPVFIAFTAERGTSTNPSAGVQYSIENGSNEVVVSGDTSAILERVSGGQLTNNYVRVNEGQTVRLRLTTYFDPSMTEFYRVQLRSVNFNTVEAAANTQQTLSPETTYETPLLYVQN